MKLAIALLLLLPLSALGQDNHLGVTLPGISGPPQRRIDVVKELGATWYRPAPVYLNGSAKCEDCDAAHAAGLNISLVVRNATEGKPSTPATNPDDFKKKLQTVLERDKPAMLVVENEPEDQKNFTGTPDQYRDEFAAACEVSHSLKIPCANGGLSSTDVGDLVIDQRFASDHIDAVNFGITTELTRIHTSSRFNVLGKGLGNDKDAEAQLIKGTQEYLAKHKEEIDRTRKFIEAVNAAHPDRFNFHWNELQPDNVPKVLDSLHQLSKLDLMCDEMGQKEQRAFEVGEKLKNALDNYVWPTIWQGTDEDGIAGLVEKNGKLRPNANAFQMAAKGQ
ncbi:MAG: hypothetical protein ROO76_00090 [Terriglobia bacterium]|jgi:hypothetical protein|nr:hypothetical protein [Terriglobia bacterium]